MRRSRVLVLSSIQWKQRAIFLRFTLDDLVFSTTLWYEGVDLSALATIYGDEALQRLLFHIAMFEINKICSLRPDRLELGPYARFYTPELDTLWRTVVHNVWAQWRYENDDPDYMGPEIVADSGAAAEPFVLRTQADVDTLVFCGGGKDSLAAMRLLERAGVRYDTFVYSSSIYGPAEAQHTLVDRLVARCAPRRQLRQWVFDDFLDSPVLRLHPELGIKTLVAAETPSSVFGVLPVVLQHGYRSLSLGHERSANTGQVVWAKTGESINHQWGKSFEAESLINSYIQQALIPDLTYFSLLKPLYDVVIFSLLRRNIEDIRYTHSCNLRKPWCLRCPKCLYVWLGYAAFLPRSTVKATFETDGLLEDPSLDASFMKLLGQGGGQPFECIGQVEEVRIYLAVCAARGYKGGAIEALGDALAPERILPLIEQRVAVDFEDTALPEGIRARVGPEMDKASAEARAWLRGVLLRDIVE